MRGISRSVWLLALATAATLALGVAAAEAASITLKLKAPDTIKVGKSFTLVAKGKLPKGSTHYLSVFFHRAKYGGCGSTVADEQAKVHYTFFFAHAIKPDKHGKYKAKATPASGTSKLSGKICGYVNGPTQHLGDKPEAKAHRDIKFT